MKTRSIKRLLPCLALILSACAQLPTDLPPRPDLLKPATGATLKELSQGANSEANATLNERWWESFGRTDLNRLIETALYDHPDLVTARARLRMADQAERLARLQTDVHYETDTSIVREKLSSNGLFPPPIGGSSVTQTTVTQTLSYNLDWWDKNRSLVRAAGNEQQAAQDEGAAIRLNVAAAVADAYFASADVAARLAISREIEQIPPQGTRSAQDSVRSGAGFITTVNRRPQEAGPGRRHDPRIGISESFAALPHQCLARV